LNRIVKRNDPLRYRVLSLKFLLSLSHKGQRFFANGPRFRAWFRQLQRFRCGIEASIKIVAIQ